MTPPLTVTKITGRGDRKTYWYNGAEPTPRAAPTTPRAPRKPYRMDPQKGKVYAAEVAAFCRGDEVTVDLPEMADLERFVWKVEHDRWFRRTFPGRTGFRVKDGRGLSRHVANAGRRTIRVSRKGRAKWVVLHELAHCLTPPGAQDHGPEYVGIYLKLVRHFLGREAWRSLYRACKERKVKTHTRRRRRVPLTSEQREALVRRLEVARSKQHADRELARWEAQVERDIERDIERLTEGDPQ